MKAIVETINVRVEIAFALIRPRTGKRLWKSSSSYCMCSRNLHPTKFTHLIIFFFTELLHKYYVPDTKEDQHEIFEKLSQYCGKSVKNYSEGEEDPLKWDFYNTFYFSYTVVSTIGLCFFFFFYSTSVFIFYYVYC